MQYGLFSSRYMCPRVVDDLQLHWLYIIAIKAAVFKKGNKQVAANYRPVSWTCVACKVLEHIVFRSVMDHVDLHKILVFFHNGFRSKHDCETQLINTIEDIAKWLNDRHQLDLLILDFSKAIDLVTQACYKKN